MADGSGFIGIWGTAVATFEGFYTPGSRPARNHNPGDLKFAGQPGAVGQDPLGFAVFPDDATGFTALDNQLQAYVRNFPGYSLYQIMEHYLGQNITTSGGEATSQGDSTAYGNFVASALGVDPSTTLGELASIGAALLPADPASPVDGSTDLGTNGILVLMVGGVFALWLIGQFLGWD